MVKLEVDSILRDSARDEYEHPLPQKACEDGRTTDFDCAVRGDQLDNNCIQAGIYRAPEVIVMLDFPTTLRFASWESWYVAYPVYRPIGG